MYINEGGDGSEKGGTRRDAFWGFGFVQCIRFSLECIIAQTAAATAVAAADSDRYSGGPYDVSEQHGRM